MRLHVNKEYALCGSFESDKNKRHRRVAFSLSYRFTKNGFRVAFGFRFATTTTTTTTTTSRSYDYCYYYYCLCYSSLAFEPFSSLLFCSCFPVSTFLSPPREGEGNDRRHEFISVSKERKINSNDFGLSSTSFAAQVSNKFDMESNASSSAWVSGSCL